jgi:hypothetical protein
VQSQRDSASARSRFEDLKPVPPSRVNYELSSANRSYGCESFNDLKQHPIRHSHQHQVSIGANVGLVEDGGSRQQGFGSQSRGI